MYVYQKTEKCLWTVGFYNPNDEWNPDSDHESPESAAKRVAYLNGGEEIEALKERLDELEKSIYHAANTASCLANGIIPD
ncbi:MAG: hypothetical protein ACW97P_12445 [Candidatus Hodarchaeales archaeon]|jgi:hypothetical protein